VNDRIIVPLDVESPAAAQGIVDLLGPDTPFYKVGLELYTASGPGFVSALRDQDKDVFLDLKLHDIPNTVARAVERAADLGVRFLTVHGTGGPRMIEAAATAAGGRLTLLAVTVLTSLDRSELSGVWGREVVSLETEVVRIARSSMEAGAGGVVCSPREARAVSDVIPSGSEVVTPGVRFQDGALDDQRRVATPAAAFRAGATRLVMGRPITRASDPAAAFRRAVEEARSAMAGVSS